jgi:hypothetical protein
MTGYKGDYQHVYVVVPKENGDGFYIIDPVTDRFNYEVPYAKKHDHMAISMLNGVGGDCSNAKPEILKLRKFVDTQEIIQRGGVPTETFLLENKIPFVPTNDGDKSGYVICQNGQLVKVPTVLSKDVSDQLKSTTPPVPVPASDQPGKKPRDWNWLWWVGIGAGALILLTGSDQDEVQAGLSGVGKLGRKTGRKLKTIRI